MRIHSVVLQLKEEDHLKVLAWPKGWEEVGHPEEVVEQGQECQWIDLLLLRLIWLQAKNSHQCNHKAYPIDHQNLLQRCLLNHQKIHIHKQTKWLKWMNHPFKVQLNHFLETLQIKRSLKILKINKIRSNKKQSVLVSKQKQIWIFRVAYQINLQLDLSLMKKVAIINSKLTSKLKAQLLKGFKNPSNSLKCKQKPKFRIKKRRRKIMICSIIFSKLPSRNLNRLPIYSRKNSLRWMPNLYFLVALIKVMVIANFRMQAITLLKAQLSRTVANSSSNSSMSKIRQELKLEVMQRVRQYQLLTFLTSSLNSLQFNSKFNLLCSNRCNLQFSNRCNLKFSGLPKIQFLIKSSSLLIHLLKHSLKSKNLSLQTMCLITSSN